MPSEISVTGGPALEAKIKALGPAMRRAALEAVQVETLEIAQDMRRDAPVKTGALKDGIQSEIDADALEGRAVSTAAHTKYVVHGTSDTEAQDFMTPAAVRARVRFPRRIRKAVAAELGKLAQ
jgi:HK97 gp10 family phage protein